MLTEFCGFGRGPRIARNKYKTYVMESDPADPSKDITGSSLLGSKAFIKWAQTTFLADHCDTNGIPELKRVKPCPSVEEIVESVGRYFKTPTEAILTRGSKCNQARDIAMYLSRQLSGCSGQELGCLFGDITGAAITMRCKRVTESRLKNRKLKRDLNKLLKIIANN